MTDEFNDHEGGMLVFTRKEGDVFRVGDDVIIRILSLSSERVRVGIKAPKDVPVNREEIYQALKKQGKKNIDKKDHSNE